MRTSLYDYRAEQNELAQLTQWPPTLNGSLTPEQVTVGSRRTVW